MLIRSIKCQAVQLPFRFSFGHALASRNFSVNLIVSVHLVLEDGREITGWGESVPRDYVTGENPQGAMAAINYTYAPQLQGKFFASSAQLLSALSAIFSENLLHKKAAGASFCALELAVLDALAQVEKLSFAQMPNLISAISEFNFNSLQWPTVNANATMRYGGVVPFGKKTVLKMVLAFYKRYGFKTVKLKVGESLNDDVARVKLARQIMGEDAIIRVDANCAWNTDQAKWSLAALRPYNVASCEQPLAADNIAGLADLTASVPEKIMVDESLTTVHQAEELIAARACNAFNIRLSKVGGIVSAMRMVELARLNKIECHLGAQVGESGILAAAQRHFALSCGDFANVEGAMNLFLLKGDLIKESMTVPPGAVAKAPGMVGLGVTVLPGQLLKYRKSGLMQENQNQEKMQKSEINAAC